MPASFSSPGESQLSPQAETNVLITGGTFPQFHGDYNINPQSFHYTVQHEIGLHTLNQAISHSAMHDSSERDPPPRCHPDTRKAIIKEIMQWIQDPAPSVDIFWLNGTAGVGKSAILQVIADLLREMDRRFGGAFFFGRGKAGRDKSDYLIPTIAYQLATLIPELRGPVDNAMRQDPALPKKNLETQMRSLIILPCQQVPAGVLSSHTPTVIIDGLDECSEHSKQVAILSAIERALNASHVPLRFLIASRPEPHITDFFHRTSCYHHGLFIPTDTKEVDEDMRKVFVDGFKDIRIRHAYTMSSLPQTWPGNEIVQKLVRKASGQFIYADTVLKFVGAEFYIPTNQLKNLLELPLISGSYAFAPLDQLYIHILSSCPHQQTLKAILAVMFSDDVRTFTDAIEDLFGLEDGEVQLTLRGLHSVVQVVSCGEAEDVGGSLTDLMAHFYPQDHYLSFYHASFLEFLLDEKRSKQFHVSQYDAFVEVISRAFQLVLSTIDTKAGCEPVISSSGQVEEPDALTKNTRQSPRPITWSFLSSASFFWCPSSYFEPDPNLDGAICLYRSWTRQLQQSLASQTALEPSPDRFRALITIFLELREFARWLGGSKPDTPENDAHRDVVDSILHISRTILNKWYLQVLTTHPLIRAKPLSLALLATSECSIGEWSRVCQIDSKQVIDFLETHTYCVIPRPPSRESIDKAHTFSIPLADLLREEMLPSDIQMTLRRQWSELCCSSSQAGLQYNPGTRKLLAQVTSSFFETPSISDVKYIDQTQAYEPLQTYLSSLVNMDWSWSSLDHDSSSAHSTFNSGLVWCLLKWSIRQAESSRLSPISQQTTKSIFMIMDKIFCGKFLLTELSTAGFAVEDLIRRSFALSSSSQNLLVIYSSLCDFLSDENRNQHTHEAIPTYHTTLLERLLVVFFLLTQDPEYLQVPRVVYKEYEKFCYGSVGGHPPRVWKQFWDIIHWKQHFSQAVESKKIENCLVAIHHMCTVSRPYAREILPTTWAEGVLEYLERIPDADSDGSLKSWCGELKNCRGELQTDV